ncbi:MAG: filamentous hemagglutinin N-terminal domain-containing protein [Coleofasciculus sp. B1-GNL1-01]|uniref:filamentous hemagglutinin N-terminal domain-containing protein n=1 Tax=Coleofasciculus sp. B1-GNL1-01 TaxID=3068484 RepID=UPI0032F39DE5
MKRRYYLLWLVPPIVFFILIPVKSVQGQIASDGSLSTDVKTADNLNFTITGENQAGENLFHSFREFSIPTNGSAFFKNSLDVQNVISRVTGDSISNIDGMLKANGNANLFLLNPNGIIFGSNASLSIGGSFVASTANSLKFEDGTEFSTDRIASPVLTVSIPVGLQFGTAAGRIVNRSQASPDGTMGAISDSVGLQVRTGKSLALVGGEVLLEGGDLTAPGGRVEVGGVSGNSLVNLQSTNRGFALNYENVQNFQDIHLSQEATIDVTDLGPFPPPIGTGVDIGSGDIQIQGRQVRLTDGAQISSITLGSVSAGTVNVTASESVELIGVSANGFSSNLNAVTFGDGNAGDVRITTRRLIVQDGAGISTGSIVTPFGSARGEGGNLTVTASESVEISGSSPIVGPSGLAVSSEGMGDAGKLTIQTENLTVRDGAEITATSNQAGGGNIDITAEDIRLRDGSLISTSVFDSIGGGGNITINSDVFIALENSDILANAVDGRGGNISIISPVFLADFFSSGQGTAVGRNPGSFEPFRGNDRVDISVEALGSGDAGNLFIASLNLNQDSLSPLSTNFLPPEQVIADSCLTHRNKEQGSFIVTGTGGLPNNPYNPLQGNYSVTQVQGISGDAGQQATAPTVNSQSSTPSFWKPGDPIQEAQGMMVTSDGRVIVGTAPELVAIANADDLICYQAASQEK